MYFCGFVHYVEMLLLEIQVVAFLKKKLTCKLSANFAKCHSVSFYLFYIVCVSFQM